MNKKRIGIMTLFVLAGLVWQAQANFVFTDNFNRANTGLTTNGANIGAGYVLASTSGVGTVSAAITNNQLKLNGAGGNHRTLSYQGLLTENTAGKSFVTSVDITLANYSTTVNVGLAFDWQDEKNFYWARLISSTNSGAGNGMIQFGQMVNGVSTSFTSANVANLNVQTGIVYNLSIASASAGVFDYMLIGGTLNLSGTRTDNVGGVDFTNGYAGLYAANNLGQPVFDNFSVTAVPEPATIGMMGLGALATIMLRRFRKY